MFNKPKFRNPIIPGFAPDPSVVTVDGTFFLVTSSFHIFPGLPIYSSRDLQNWDHIGHTMIATGGLFAATIRHHHGRFYIVCTNCGSSNGSSDLENFIIHTSDIWSGKWSDPVSVDFHGIDPSLFFDDDDRVYFQGCFVMDRSKQPSCTIKQVEIDVHTGKQLSEQREIWGGYARYDTEGPHVYKVDVWYYLLVAEGGTFEHHMLSIARSKDIWGPYESFGGNPIMTADGKDEYIQNIGHGELFQDARGAWWAAVLGIRRDGDGCAAMGRESFLAPVEWPQGGWPRIHQPKMEFERELTDAQLSSVDSTARNPPAGVQNVFIKDPDFSKYRLSEDDEHRVTLLPSRLGFSSPTGTCTFLGRRQRSLTDWAIACLELNNNMKSAQGLQAGLAMYRDSVRHVSIAYDSDAKAVVCHAFNSATGLSRVFPNSLLLENETRKISFKIQASETEWKFYAVLHREDVDVSGVQSPDLVGYTWEELGTVAVKDLDARDFTGPILGVFAQTSVEETENVPITFCNFSVDVETTKR
ncbi:glycosyl hydrolase [Colletotrichum godetiae]|uniref:Glycosyl hydrolase n=1 Tax=Colletotrichum godetiae TaxID=1209918 RepID=A0AAJ0AGV9_9PEZI|nr:glycosyl hydrolase [Colletotrichum godetiae]KAK1673668.1 glycosyl hydrolase [Colletotrichum godetiae]